MRAPMFQLLLLTQTLWLANCAPNEPNQTVVAPRVAAALSEQTAALRRASIRKQIAAVCPAPLSNDELEWAAEFVEENRSKGAVWITGRLLKMHRETKICRGTR